jgi:1-aminocyclopropane-1-carboxylate deaminase
MSLRDKLRLSTPIELLDSNYLKKQVKLLIKRDDLIHPWINGNKWRKLQGHLDHYEAHDYNGIITYGGANSNHLVAVACACYHLNIPAIGIVRTYKLDEKSPIIRKLRSWHMLLIAISPSEYRQKDSSASIRDIINEYPNHMIIPEGGTSEHAMIGLKNLANEIVVDPLYEAGMDILISVGTGGMLAGLYRALPDSHQFKVISPFKDNVTHVKGLDLLHELTTDRIQFDSMTGGKRFGAYDPESVKVINEFYDTYGMLLDPIYTVKAVRWLINQVATQENIKGKSILFIHSGGLPGIMAYNYVYESKPIQVTVPPEYNHLQ